MDLLTLEDLGERVVVVYDLCVRANCSSRCGKLQAWLGVNLTVGEVGCVFFCFLFIYLFSGF